MLIYHPLHVLDLRKSTLNKLYKCGVVSVEDVILLSRDRLDKIMGISYPVAIQINYALQKFKSSSKESLESFTWFDFVKYHVMTKDFFIKLRAELLMDGVFGTEDYKKYKNLHKNLPEYMYQKLSFLDRNKDAVASSYTVFSFFAEKFLNNIIPYVESLEERIAVFDFLADVYVNYFLFSNSHCKVSVLDDDSVRSLFYNDERLCRVAKRLMIAIAKSQNIVLFSELMEKYGLPIPTDKVFVDNGYNSLNYKIILIADNSYTIEPYRLTEWLAFMSGRDKRLFLERLKGKTLQEIGDENSCTRENIRLRIDRLLSKRPVLYEDKWISLYKKYCIRVQPFTAITKEPASTFYYLFSVANAGKRPIESMLEDETIPYYLRDNLRKFLQRDFQLIDGELIKPTLLNVLDKAVKKVAQNGISVDDFFVFYKDFVKDNNFNDRHINKRSVLGRLVRSKYALFMYGNMFRFYPIFDIDISSLEEKLGLKDFSNCILSTKILFYSHLDVMKEYDIYDEYELHNLLKRRGKDLQSKITFRRMPNLQFGNGSCEAQLVDILREHKVISLEKLSTVYCDKYGINKDTFYAGYLKHLKPYRKSNGIYQYKSDNEMLSEKEISGLKGILKEAFYSEKDAFVLLGKKLPKKKVKFLDDAVFWKLGYRHTQGVYFKKQFSYVVDAMEEYFKSPMCRVDKALLYVPAVRPYLVEKMHRYELFRCSEEMAVSRKWLDNHGFTVKAIKDFVFAVEKFVDDKTFSIFSLKKAGFKHKWLDNESDYWLLSSFLRTSKDFKFYTSFDTVFFNRRSMHPGIKSIVEDLFTENGFIPRDIVREKIYNNFNIEVSSVYLLNVYRILGYGRRRKK